MARASNENKVKEAARALFPLRTRPFGFILSLSSLSLSISRCSAFSAPSDMTEQSKHAINAWHVRDGVGVGVLALPLC
ncbi:hypothetical protein BT93_B2889 [Corymbia citriodora subsp. variegata]|nr:hypothetical protein BT93_B2889 [Corymbia citriodora subsp. variegata]